MGAQILRAFKRDKKMKLLALSVFSIISGNPTACKGIKKWTIIKSLSENITQKILETAQLYQKQAAFEEIGMVDEAAVYAASFESAQKDLSSAFEGEFCSSPRRFEPVLQLIKLIVPSYVDEMVADQLEILNSEKFGKDLISNLKEMIWSSLLEVVYSAHDMTSEVSTVTNNRKFYFGRIVDGLP